MPSSRTLPAATSRFACETPIEAFAQPPPSGARSSPFRATMAVDASAGPGSAPSIPPPPPSIPLAAAAANSTAGTGLVDFCSWAQKI
nr:unnamed protein product [Digitaria exilis]